MLMRHGLSRISRIERDIIGLLRAAHAHPRLLAPLADRMHVPDRVLAPLSSLALAAARRGYALWSSDTAHLGMDEMKLLGWLSLHQRERPDDFAEVDPALREDLARCAAALGISRLRLPYQAVLRIAPSDISGDARAQRGARRLRSADVGPSAAEPRRRRGSLGRTTLKARAVALAREHGCVPTQAFGAIGISRQYLSKLCMNGALVRVRYGFYRTPGQAGGADTSVRETHAPSAPLTVPTMRFPPAARAWRARIGGPTPTPSRH